MFPFRFAASIPSAPSLAEWLARVRETEALGFDLVAMPDHIGELFTPFEALMAAASVTDRVGLGTLVLNNDFRHPAFVARQAAMLQEFCGGRFELGLGAGHAHTEYAELGLPFDEAKVRVARLSEAVPIVRDLLAGETVDVAGEHYTLTGHRTFPVPAVRPRIMVGGNGRRLLRMAAREADIIGFTGLGKTLEDGQHHAASGFAAAEVDGRVALVREAAGDRFDALELNVLVQVVRITEDRESTAAELATRIPGLTPAEILDTPFILLGTAAEIAAQVRRNRERWGFTYVSTFWQNVPALAEVIPLLRP